MILKPKPLLLASISKGFSTPVPRNSKDEVFPVVSAGGNTRFNTGGWSRRGALGGVGWFCAWGVVDKNAEITTTSTGEVQYLAMTTFREDRAKKR
jgi:hypothetical protein